MNSKGNIVFLGMMGSGKSSIGRLISKKLKLDFYDVDKEIEKKLKMKISKIFIEKGETYFRNYEEKVALNLLKKNNIIIALGGGTFLNDNVRKEIITNHISFWLNWDDKVLIDRIKKTQKRPIAMKLNETQLKNLIKKRSNIYCKALYKINCNQLKKNEITDKILKIYEKI